MNERLDRVLACSLSLSRSDIKKQGKKMCIKVNGEIASDLGMRVDTEGDSITVDGKSIFYKKHIYLMMNKPKGVVSASEDGKDKTVVDLVPEKYRRDGLFPAGRLDKDTTGFVLITDDGAFAHRILSPKNHIEKTYHALLERELTQDETAKFLSGIELKDGTLCLEARVKMLQDNVAQVVIHEGKYHQVKRMFAALGNHVIELKRVKMGGLALDEGLREGECRELSKAELDLIEGQ